MPRKPKEHVNYSCKMAADVFEQLQKMSDETGLPKTTIVEKALKKYIEKYDKTEKN